MNHPINPNQLTDLANSLGAVSLADSIAEVQAVSPEDLAKLAPCKACNGTGGFTYTDPSKFYLLQPLWRQCERCNGTKHEPLVEVAPASAPAPAPYTCDYCHKPMLAQRLVDDTAGGESNICSECAPYGGDAAYANLKAILEAVQESLDNGYDARTLGLWVAGLANDAVMQLGFAGLRPAEFDAKFAKKGGNNGQP